MNFKVNRKVFMDALNIASRAISPTTPLPSLLGIKIECDEDKISLISSDSNISIKTIIDNSKKDTLTINETGEVLIESKYILEIVRKCSGEYIDIVIIDGQLLKISDGNSEYKINGLNPSDYPTISFDISKNTFKLETLLFNQIVEQTSFACSDSDTRPVLTGVNFKCENNILKINATDTYRLASKTINLNNNFNFNITVPAKYLMNVYHSINEVNDITIGIDSTKIMFIFDNTIIETRLLDDDFPDTSKLIPQTFKQVLKVSSKEFVNAIDRTSFIKIDGKNIVKLSISDTKVDITATASNQIGSFFESIRVISFEGEPFNISCSVKYLTDAIKALDSENITISFVGELKPMIIKGETDESIVQLISPVRTY